MWRTGKARCARFSEAGLNEGRRDSIVLVAEGAIDRDGERHHSETCVRSLPDKMDEDVRITVLGHVQRGGSPTAFDRISEHPHGCRGSRRRAGCDCRRRAGLIGIINNKITRLPLMECVNTNQAINQAIRDL